MNAQDIIKQLESLKDNSRSFVTNEGDDDIWAADVEALDAAIEIIQEATNPAKAHTINLETIVQKPDEMKDPLEEIKVVSALNSEIMKFDYRKEHAPKDISILDYTVMMALARQVPQVPGEHYIGEVDGMDYFGHTCKCGCELADGQKYCPENFQARRPFPQESVPC